MHNKSSSVHQELGAAVRMMGEKEVLKNCKESPRAECIWDQPRQTISQCQWDERRRQRVNWGIVKGRLLEEALDVVRPFSQSGCQTVWQKVTWEE